MTDISEDILRALAVDQRNRYFTTTCYEDYKLYGEGCHIFRPKSPEAFDVLYDLGHGGKKARDALCLGFTYLVTC